MCLLYKYFENTLGKGDIACKEQFVFFPVFPILFVKLSAIFVKLKIVLCKLFKFEFVVWKRV